MKNIIAIIGLLCLPASLVYAEPTIKKEEIIFSYPDRYQKILVFTSSGFDQEWLDSYCMTKFAAMKADKDASGRQDILLYAPGRKPGAATAVCAIWPSQEEPHAAMPKFTDKETITLWERSFSPTFTAEALMRSYLNNEVTADDTYRNKDIKITGTVASISKGVRGKIYISFKTDDPIRRVQCFLRDENDPIIRTAKKGDKIMLIGTCTGLSTNVIMQECFSIKFVQEKVDAAKKTIK
jgi:hypothetical protein